MVIANCKTRNYCAFRTGLSIPATGRHKLMKRIGPKWCNVTKTWKQIKFYNPTNVGLNDAFLFSRFVYASMLAK